MDLIHSDAPTTTETRALLNMIRKYISLSIYMVRKYIAFGFTIVANYEHIWPIVL